MRSADAMGTGNGHLPTYLDADDPRVVRLEQEQLARLDLFGTGVTPSSSVTQDSGHKTQFLPGEKKRALGETSVPLFVSEAVDSMTLDGLPDTSTFPDPDLALRLLALCRNLSRTNRMLSDASETFYLSCRDAAAALGVPDLYRRVHRHLTKWFPARGWLIVAKPGNRHLANEYQMGEWVAPPPPARPSVSA